MKKLLLGGLLALYSFTVLAVDYREIAINRVKANSPDVGIFKSISENGYAFVLGVNGSNIVDTNISYTDEEVIAGIGSYLKELAGTNEYADFFQNYPDLPDDPSRYVGLGINKNSTVEQYRALAKSLVDRVRAMMVGRNFKYPFIPGYTIDGYRGGILSIRNTKLFETRDEELLYICDFNQWNFDINFEEMLNKCLKKETKRSLVGNIPESMLMSLNINNKGILSGVSKSGDKFFVIDKNNNFVESRSVGKQIPEAAGNVIVSNGDNPLISLSGSDVIFRYTNGSLREYSTSMYPGDPMPGKIVYINEETAVLYERGGISQCNIDIDNTGKVDYIDYLIYRAGTDELLKNYPNKPGNFSEIAKKYNLDPNMSDEEFKNKIDDSATNNKEYQDYKLKNKDVIGCKRKSTKLIASKAIFNFAAEYKNEIIIGYVSNPQRNDFSFLINNLTKGEILVPAYEIYKALNERSDFLLDLAYKKVKSARPNLLESFPMLPNDLEKAGLYSDTTMENYIGYASGKIIDQNPYFPYSSTNSSQLGRWISTGHFSKGALYTNGGILKFEPASVVVIANPETLTIDPYLNPVSEIDISTDGQSYAADIECSLTGPMALSRVEYSDWGGTSRFALPVQWQDKKARGIISLTGSAKELEGKHSFMKLGTLAEVTTGKVDVTCSGTVSDKKGNTLPVEVVNAHIQLDDKIHGGAGQLKGQVQLPDGVQASNVVVEVTVNGRTIKVPVKDDGSFMVEGLRDGQFTVNVKTDRYVQSCIKKNVKGAVIQLGTITLVPGDINNDGEINIADYTLLSGIFGTSKGDERYRAEADLNNDGTINVQDLAILGSHFGTKQCNPAA